MFSHDRLRSFWRLALYLHLLAAAAWIYLMPGGFPLAHPRFLANRVLPVVIIAVCGAGIVAFRSGRKATVDAIYAALATGWFVAAVTGVMLFPVSAPRLFPIAMVMAFGLALPILLAAARQHLRSRLTAMLALFGALIGGIVPWTQRAETPTTFPLNSRADTNTLEPAMTAPGEITMVDNLRFIPRDGSITLLQGRHVTSIDPLLTFISRSPDRCWTLFAPARSRHVRERHLTHWFQESSEIRMRYSGLVSSDLVIRRGDRETVGIEALSKIDDPVYSHLNTYCEISLTGYERLALAFSPCAGTPVDVLPMGYPVGKPARFAYLDDAGRFHIVEARSGEKGPFHELAGGRLERGDPLEITLLDSGQPVAAIVLEDWSRQVSTELSPTAGWGVPQNAIEFSLDETHPQAGASIFVTLASTSVGRGYDSVGHAAGTYRNRMKVRLIQP